MSFLQDDSLPSNKVRWYYFKQPFSSKSLQESPDIPQRGSLIRFCDADNLALEEQYRSNREAIDAFWWEEEAYTRSHGSISPTGVKGGKFPEPSSPADPSKTQLKERPTSHIDRTPPSSPEKYLIVDDRPSSWNDFLLNMESRSSLETVGVQVRGRTYEVDLFRKLMKPCYWPAAKHRILRGTWFVDKQGDFIPVREVIAERLEQGFLSRAWDPSKGLLKMQSDGRLAARVELSSNPGPTGMYALFYSGYEVYLAWDTSFAWIKKKLSKSGGETRLALRRGYREPESPAALQREANIAQEEEDNEVAMEPTPSALILAVHGIGQNLQGANIAEDVLNMKKALRKASKIVFKGDEESNSVRRKRVEVLPVQWRKTLTLEVDSLAASLMPPGIPSLRHMLHSTAVEVLFYLTPLHRGAILDSVVNSLNSAYKNFIQRHPDFDGKISIFAHSLGSVLCWDILCNQVDLPSSHGDDKFPNMSPGWTQNGVTIGKLNFEVDHFFVAGSPLGCFLSLRGINQAMGIGLGTAKSAPLMQCNPSVPSSPDGLPSVKRLYNIFHPYDPVAYHLEPLAYSKQEMEGRRLALVELVSGGRRIHIAAQELGDNMSTVASKFGSSIAEAFRFGRKARDPDGLEETEYEGNDLPSPRDLADTDTSMKNVNSDKNSSIARIVGGCLPKELGRPLSSQGRIDFALQEASLEHQYLAALGAHFLYWASEDVSLFVYRALMGYDPISGSQIVDHSLHSKS